jgi:3'-phosphoadenosine 5'-phosphosulfate sulfotransferase (PAPS reductase)/FAD synthetase
VIRRLFISCSFGETSALMTRLLLTRWRDRYDEVVVVSANTGEERPEWLKFAKQCDDAFGFGTVLVEAVINPDMGEGTTHRVVTFDTADMSGRPFEDMIKKYGIPGPGRLHCTRELKTNAMLSYVNNELGWEKGTYDTAIGIRADEAERRDENHVAKRIVYPLLDWLPMSKPEVNEFWARQPFRLELTGYQGNCKWCWKKSMRKHMTLMSEDPSLFDFPERMEELYPRVGAEFLKDEPPPYERRVFFRGHLSTKDLRATYELNKDSLEKAEDDSVVLPDGTLFPLDLSDADSSNCQESCEAEPA